jgi:hypothetical protein
LKGGRRVKLFNLKNSAYEQYRQTVKGNETITYEQAQKKLTRNVLLSVRKKSLSNTLKLQQEYIYGYMRIIVRFGIIVEIENKIKDTIPRWSKDKEKYIKISKELGINGY